MDLISAREPILHAVSEALRRVDGERVVRAALRRHRCDPPPAVLAVGKAARSMFSGLQKHFGDLPLNALVVDGESRPVAGATHVQGSHPIPDSRSLAAGQAVCEFVSSLSAGEPLIVLLSGGSSALMELPLAHVNLEDLRRINRWLLASGLTIGQMNSVRRALSQIKAGGLAELSEHLDVEVLLISDVAGDDTAVIGSGPFCPSPSELPADLPQWLQAKLIYERSSKRVFPEHRIVANNNHALQSAARYLRRSTTLPVRVHEERLCGDVGDIAHRLNTDLTAHAGVWHVWGGEPTVMLPEQAGIGGRAQHLALSVVSHWVPDQQRILLCAGTDGIDGNSTAAGALISSVDLASGVLQPEQIRASLDSANSGQLLEEAGCLLDTGPTGTNVRDISIGLSLKPFSGSFAA